MHLPDPSKFTFGTAIVNLAIAITAVIRLILEKKNHSKNDTGDKNETKDSKKTDRWLELGRAGNRLTHTPVAFFKKPSVAQRLKQMLFQKKRSHVLILGTPGSGKTELFVLAGLQKNSVELTNC